MATGPGVATLLFTDLVGSTALTDRLGDDRAEELRRSHFRLIREVVAASGGQEVKTLGDGHMVVFGSPLDAIGCAIAIQQSVQLHNSEPGAEQLVVRIGINAGEVFHDENDYFGTPVVVAKRLCDQAAGGQIIVSDLVAALVGSRGQFAFREIGALQLRGLSQPLPAREVVWRHDAVPPLDGQPGRARRGRRAALAASTAIVVAVAVTAVVLSMRGDEPPRADAQPAPTSGTLLEATGTVRSPEAPASMTFVAAPGDVVTLRVTRVETNLDLFAEVVDRDGVVEAFDDDSGAGFEPTVERLAITKSGTHRVLVHVVAPSTSGSFHVTVTRTSRSTAPGPVYGDLRAPSQQDRSPQVLRAGEQIRVLVTIDTFRHYDAVVELYSPEGRLVASDDDSGKYHDPEIKAFRVPSSGTYTVVVRGTAPTELGAYRLQLLRA